MKTLILLLALASPLLAEVKKFTLTARASEIDPRTKEHPEIDYVFKRKGKPADNPFASVDTRVKASGYLVIWLMEPKPELFDPSTPTVTTRSDGEMVRHNVRHAAGAILRFHAHRGCLEIPLHPSRRRDRKPCETRGTLPQEFLRIGAYASAYQGMGTSVPISCRWD